MALRFEIVEYRGRYHWRVRRDKMIAFRSTDFATEEACRRAIEELKRARWHHAEVVRVVKAVK
jgi:uncharacterized protein YegP (UPF0339 family)